jgi:RNA polymerase sigma factor (sigma-70 family)
MHQHRDAALGSGAVCEPQADSSSALILRARAGDENARNELFARYLPRLRRWAHGRLPAWTRDHLDTEDIVQDTLVQSLRRLEAFTPRHQWAFCAYVCEALRNRLHDVVRRASRRPLSEPFSTETPAAEPSPLEYAIGHQVLHHYDAALRRLRATDRELIIARVELHLDYDEIAPLLGKSSVGAARIAVSRALLRLGQEMARETQY